MLQSQWKVSLLVLVAGLQTTGAFLPATGTTRMRVLPPTTSCLQSSNDPMVDMDDDDISKLIGKRGDIKRKKAEDKAAEDAEMAKKLEPTIDLDLDKLPEFKTERVRRAGKDDEGSKKGKKGGKKSKKGEEETKKEESPIVDFMAEYQDENDFHIPNRIGFSTLSWGDKNRNFVGSGQKLTKGMIKAGKFNPGDLQLAYNNLLQGGITLGETSLSYGADSRGGKLSMSGRARGRHARNVTY
jgi:hypothetical protein